MDKSFGKVNRMTQHPQVPFPSPRFLPTQILDLLILTKKHMSKITSRSNLVSTVNPTLNFDFELVDVEGSYESIQRLKNN